MNGLHRHEGTCEDTQGLFASFEKYLMKVLKLLGEMQECYLCAMPPIQALRNKPELKILKNNEIGFHIYQPGSTVVTSLIAPESKPKVIGLLEINNQAFRILPIKLDTVRPFIYSNVKKNINFLFNFSLI